MISKTLSIIFITLSMLTNGVTQAQYKEVNGTIVDAKTNAPIPYVNIVVPAKKAGTITNSEGAFSLSLEKITSEDIIEISTIGFTTKTMTLNQMRNMLSENPIIAIEESTTALEEVLVVSKKNWKEKTLGSTTTAPVGYGFAPKIGSEIGRKIKIRKKNTKLLQFSTHVSENSYESIKLRLNIYSIKNDLPNEKLNANDIYIDFNQNNGFINVDLEDYNIVVSEDIIVMLQWVDNKGEGAFKFSCKFPGLTTLLLNSYGLVQKFPITLGYNVKVRY